MAGVPAMEIARRLDVAFSTVNNRLRRSGLYRADYPVRLPAPAGLAGAQAAGGGGAPMPALELPEAADDALALVDALDDWSVRLLRAGYWVQAERVDRMTRGRLQTRRARARADAGGEAEDAEWEEGPPAGPPPALRAAQRAPEGDWRTWLFLGGRGAGKTLAGAAWLAGRAREVGRLALVAPTLLDAREVMIEGPSGIRGAAAGFGPPDGGRAGRAVYLPSLRRLEWPNGAVARVFSAEDPESLRGPQFAAAWADEVCAWPKPEATLAMLRMGLRLGEDPRLALTTTPRPAPWLRGLLAEPGLVVTRGSAADNAEWLAPGFVEGLRALYGGTRLERQEIEGEVLEAPEGGVFRYADLVRARALGAAGRPERLERLVVAVDPPAGLLGAACGVVTVGRGADGTAWVLEDATAAGLSPGGWAARVGAAAARAGRLGPVEVAAEANQGGEMVRQVLLDAGVGAPVRLVHATLGKRARAEPVGLLYEQGRVAHAADAPGGLGPLEDQLLLLGAGAEDGRRGESPDRADALVWGLTELLGIGRPAPRLRML